MAAIVTSPLQVFAVLCLAVFGIKGQIRRLGHCPELYGHEDFQLQYYLGVWYEAQVYRTILDIAMKCPATEYNLLPNGEILIQKHYTNLLFLKKTAYGIAKIKNPVPYRFYLRIPWENPLSLFHTDVLYTDYTDYAIVYTCREGFISHKEFVWIMTRKRVASDKTIRAARKKMRELGLDTRRLVDVDQSCKDVRKIIRTFFKLSRLIIP